MLRRRIFLCGLLLISTFNYADTTEPSSLIPLNFGFYPGFEKTYPHSPYKVWLEAALKREGYRPQIHWLPGRRILSQVNNGLLDGDLLRAEAVVKANFPNLVQVPTRFGRACYAGYGYAPRDSNKIIRKDMPLQIGNLEGLLHVKEEAQKHFSNSSFSVISDTKTALKLLAAGRLDLMLLPPQPISRFELIFATKLVRLTAHEIQFDAYMYLNPRHRELAEKLAVSLEATKPDAINLDCPSP